MGVGLLIVSIHDPRGVLDHGTWYRLGVDGFRILVSGHMRVRVFWIWSIRIFHRPSRWIPKHITKDMVTQIDLADVHPIVFTEFSDTNPDRNRATIKDFRQILRDQTLPRFQPLLQLLFEALLS